MPAEVADEQVGEVVGEAVAHDDAQRGEVLAVLGERVGRDEPAAVAEALGDVEHRVGPVGAVEREGEHGELAAVGQQAERAERAIASAV